MTTQGIKKLFAKFFDREKVGNVIILGTEYPEYKLYKLLHTKGNKILFFISQDPWKYNSKIEDAFCRYPNELYSLCDNYKVDKVYYCESVWLNKISALPEHTTLIKHC